MPILTGLELLETKEENRKKVESAFTIGQPFSLQ